MAKPDFRRTRGKMTERPFFHYLKPTRQVWVYRPAEDIVVEPTNTLVMNVAMFGATEQVGPVPVQELDLEHYFGWADKVAIKERLRDIAVHHVNKANRLVSPGDDVKYTYQMTIQVIARVRTWPDEPGVTGIPWLRLGVGVECALGTNFMDANRNIIPALLGAEAGAYRRKEAPWKLGWLCHPVTFRFARALSIDDYVTLVEDDRVPIGTLELAEGLE